MKRWVYIVPIVFAVACKQDPLPEPQDRAFEPEIPEGFPDIEYPDDNAPTMLRVELGERLFFDKRLSADNSLSCGSCHFPEIAFTDGEPKSVGFEGQTTLRNSPSIVNVAWQERLFADGGVPTLELQVLAPIDAHDEFNTTPQAILEKIGDDEVYNHLSQIAYGREQIDLHVITRSIANFERTLIGGDSRYDSYLQGEENVLSEEEKWGYELFTSEDLQCWSCHSGFLLSDQTYHNIGLYEDYADIGRERVSNELGDRGKFKTPSLRNVAVTAPYMHDGSIASLEQVIDHFDSGGLDHANKDERISPLGLSSEEKSALLAFLKTLTDERYVQQ